MSSPYTCLTAAATVHADGNGAWVNLSNILTQGNTYKAVYGDGEGALTSYRSNFN